MIAPPTTDAELFAELARIMEDPTYFADTYCEILDPVSQDWIPFDLWDDQRDVMWLMFDERLLVVLKARQLGLTWLALAFTLHQMIFNPIQTVLLFSRRDDEAIELLDTRLKGMYKRLPDWITRDIDVVESSKHIFRLSNGSSAHAFPTTGGDSYSATLAIVDEADLVKNLETLMTSVKPTIDAGGKLFLISRSDKARPMSQFKKIYRAARDGLSDWIAIFLPWHARPDRDADWYERQRADVLSRTTVLDDLHEQYPATDAEALAPRSLDKRFAQAWLLQCYDERMPIVDLAAAPSLPGLEVYEPPITGRRYVIGADTCEGNPTSDPSAITVVDHRTGEEVAALSMPLQPAVLGAAIAAISRYYNRAAVLVERNNHGHSVILWLQERKRSVKLLNGRDGKVGWLSSPAGKVSMYDTAADTLRDGDATIHSLATFTELSSIEGATLRAPDKMHDDRADSFVLAQVARTLKRTGAPIAHGKATRKMTRRSR